MQKENKMEKLREFLLDNNYKKTQTFNCRNVVNDTMINVYCKDGIYVDYCACHNYLEIFGLTDKEYKSLKDILNIIFFISKKNNRIGDRT